MASEFQRGLAQGRKEGFKDGIGVALKYLEERYLEPKVVRGSKLGEDILQMARELAAHLRGR